MGDSRDELGSNWKLGENLEIPPVRSLSDFIAEKARFEIPPFRDMPRWNNRILSNLLYYQTNYLIVVVVLVAFSAVLHAGDTVVGLSAIAVLGAAVVFSLSTHPTIAQARREHAMATLGGFVVAAYYFIYSIGAVVVVLFTLALPLLLVMVHASVRLRNMKAKFNQQFTRITQIMQLPGFKRTFMAYLLEVLGVDVAAY